MDTFCSCKSVQSMLKTFNHDRGVHSEFSGAKFTKSKFSGATACAGKLKKENIGSASASAGQSVGEVSRRCWPGHCTDLLSEVSVEGSTMGVGGNLHDHQVLSVGSSSSSAPPAEYSVEVADNDNFSSASPAEISVETGHSPDFLTWIRFCCPIMGIQTLRTAPGHKLALMSEIPHCSFPLRYVLGSWTLSRGILHQFMLHVNLQESF